MNSEENAPQRKRAPSKFLYLLAAGAAALGLIGLGAYAAFSTTTTSSQQILLGQAPNVVLSGEGLTYISSGNNTPTLVFDAYSAGSTSFTTGDMQVNEDNIGATTATDVNAILSQTPGSGAASTSLAAGIGICIINNAGTVEANGLLSSVSFPQAGLGDPTIAAGQSDTYVVNIFAGTEPTVCGSTAVGGNSVQDASDTLVPALTTAAEGGSDNVSLALTWQ